MGTVSALTRHQPAKPVTTAEVLDAAEAALATHKAITDDLAQIVVQRMRHLMNLAIIPAAAPAKPVLRPLALLDVAQADKFLTDLDCHVQGADTSKLAYLLGQAEGHLQNMTEIISAVTGLPR